MSNQTPNPNYSQQQQWAPTTTTAPSSSPTSQSSGPTYSFAQPSTPQYPPAFQQQQHHHHPNQQATAPSQNQTQFHHYQPTPSRQPAPGTRFPVTAPFQIPRMYAWPSPGVQPQHGQAGQNTAPIDPRLTGDGSGNGGQGGHWPPASRG